MKIAVISDIHGNMEALEAVLKDIKNKNCDKVFALGDYAMAGPEPSKSVNFFMDKLTDSSFYLIQGNTDLMIADYTESFYESMKSKIPVMSEALKNDYQILSNEQKEFLKKLPTQMELEFEGIKFLLVHGSPRRNNEDILPEQPLEKIEEIISGVSADVILCGHTHLPCGYQTNTKQTVVNVGSVGRPFTTEPNSCYLIIEIENGQCSFEHNFINYNNKLASEKVIRRGFIGAEKLAATLLNPIERHF